MKLRMYIQNNYVPDVDLSLPAPDEFLDFKSNHEMRKKYIELMICSIKNKYQKLIESNAWEIYMVADSKVCDWINMEEELELFEQNINE